MIERPPPSEERRRSPELGALVGLLAIVLCALPGGPFARAPEIEGGLAAADEGGRLGAISLEVRDATGAVVPRPRAFVEGLDASEVEGDANGRVRLDGVPVGARIVAIAAPGYARARIHADVGSGEGLLRVELRPETL
ncbi:MAG: carboxypeptidase regulatory-like domain-containing protein, partial [Polyangiaceae bacterium]|nr:carboxypeptidase regulatory-like domain-containing protein [Polyangiaceae bacterium]